MPCGLNVYTTEKSNVHRTHNTKYVLPSWREHGRDAHVAPYFKPTLRELPWELTCLKNAKWRVGTQPAPQGAPYIFKESASGRICTRGCVFIRWKLCERKLLYVLLYVMMTLVVVYKYVYFRKSKVST